MYKIYLPINSDYLIKEQEYQDFIQKIKKMGVYGLFLVPLVEEGYGTELDEKLEILKTVKEKLDRDGIDSVLWIGYTLFHCPDSVKERFTLTEGRHGAVDLVISSICPLDKRVGKYLGDVIKKTASYGFKKIMLDDDFRMQFVCSEARCFCELHMQKYREIFGEDISKDELKEKIFSKEPNKYREAWIRINSQAMRELCASLRAAADEVDESVNVGMCAAPSHWWAGQGDSGNSIDDASADLLAVPYAVELVKILAGKNPPMLRLSGGPYWRPLMPNVFDMSMPEIIDFSRRQAAYCKDKGILTLAEGDTWPKWRHTVPASALENFDLAVRADGNYGGILKYLHAYEFPLGYEQGYFENFERNLDLYPLVDKIFNGGKTWGMYPFKPFDQIEYMSLAPNEGDIRLDLEKRFLYSYANSYLLENSFPTTFEEDAPIVVFGEDALRLSLDKCKNGLLLDIKSAKILQERGIRMNAEERAFEGESSLYSNAEGERFAVLPHDMTAVSKYSTVYRNYNHQKELFKIYEYLTGEKPLVVCCGHPHVYLLVKKSAGKVAVGVWNFSLDRISGLRLMLPKPFSSAQIVNAKGRLEDNCVIIDELYAQEFCAVGLED